MTVRGVDLSDNQAAALPFPAWAADGCRVVGARKTIGFRDDLHFPRYVAEAHAAGMVVFAYHAILGHAFYDPVKQAIDFLANMPAEVAYLVLDDEAQGVSPDDVLAWVGYVVAHSALPLVLYGNWNLVAHLTAHPELKQYGVWWAGYPTAPLLTTEPPWPTPKNVPAGVNVIAWQFAGDNGRFPPYHGPVDLTDWYSLPTAIVTPPPTDTLAADVAGHARAILGMV